MKRSFVLGLMAIFSVVLFSCGGGSDNSNNNNNSTSKDIYVSGYYTDATTGKEVACYWKNGTKTDLGNTTEDSLGVAIYVSGSDVYVAGHYTATNDTACYWKNGTKVDLGDGTSGSYTNGIYVDGANIYVAGYYNDGANERAVLWTTNAATELVLGTAGVNSEGQAMYKSGNTLYISGSEDSKPVYWTYDIVTKAVPVKVTVSSDSASAFDITVSGSNVYTAGELDTGPKLQAISWKNTTATTLSLATEFGTASGIAVSGTDVYVAGVYSSTGVTTAIKPVYWKNSTLTPLSTAKTTEIGGTSRVIVNGGDVYITGFYADALPWTYAVAAYWKNGTKVDLSSATGQAMAIGIFVK